MANVTIPSLPVWGLGPNPLTGQELFEISPTSSTATPSSQLSLLNLAKFPMILPSAVQGQINLNPSSFILAGYSVGSATAVGVTLNQLQVSQGNVPAGGSTGQALVKLSNTNFDDNWGSVGVPGGGSGLGSVTANALLYGNGTAALGVTNAQTGAVLTTDNTTGIPSLSTTLPAAVQLNITQVGTIGTGTWSGTLISPTFGGTGRANLTAHGVLIGAGTASVNVTPAPTAAQVLLGQTSTSDPAWTTIVGDWTLTAAGTATISNNAVTYAKFQQAGALSVIGVAGNATANVAAIGPGSAGNSLIVNNAGTGLVFGMMSLTAGITGVLTVPNGGTGDATMTSFGLLIGNGTAAISTLPVPSAGQLLVGQTTTSSPAFTTIVGDVNFTSAGTATIQPNVVTFSKIQTMTGLSVMGVTGTTTTNASTIVGTAGQVLQVNPGGTAVLFSTINLASTANFSGVLAIANGGTNASVAATAVINLGAVSLTAANQTLSAGFNVTPFNLGTSSAGTTITIAYGNGSLQKLIANSTFTLAATTASDGEADVLLTNGASASTITFSNFSVGSNTGDTYTTASTNKFIVMARTINGSATYKLAALQ